MAKKGSSSVGRSAKCATCGKQFIRAVHMEKYCSLECHFFPNVDTRGRDECWPWRGHLSHGYGAIQRRLVRYQATHLALKFGKGVEVPVGMFACHTCDNPPCCNPEHLWVGTSAENILDMTEKGRRRSLTRLGNENPNGKLRDEDIEDILAHPRRYGLNIELAEKYGVHKAYICRLRRGHVWKGLTNHRPSRKLDL